MGNSRRKFIEKSLLTGLVACFLRPLDSLAKPTKTTLKHGAVILFQGDSITDGNRGRNADPNHIMGHGYAFSVASRLGADHPGQRYVFYNRGISGNRVTDLENRWQTDTLDLKPDVLSILIGINDCSSTIFHGDGGAGVSIEMYEKKLDGLLELTRTAFPNMIFVLCEPFILPVGRVKENWEAYRADILQRQEVVRKLAQKFEAVFVGFQHVVDEACKKAPPEYWMWDGIHPTVAGHELLAREWLKQVERSIIF